MFQKLFYWILSNLYFDTLIFKVVVFYMVANYYVNAVYILHLLQVFALIYISDNQAVIVVLFTKVRKSLHMSSFIIVK